jgi:hypothetical protein
MVDPLATAKEIGKLVKEYNDIPLKTKIVQLTDQIIQLQEENRALKQRLANQDEMIPKGPNNYFYKGDRGPYCPTCWQRDNKPVLLPAVDKYITGSARRCTVCKEMFYDE